MSRDNWLPAFWGGRNDAFTALRRQIDDIFDDLTRPGRPGVPAGVFDPKIDVAETDSELTITAELPGMTDKDVEVTMSGDLLTIRGEKTHELKEEGPKPDEREAGGNEGAQNAPKSRRVYHRVERTWGAFERTIRVPFEFDAEKVKADFANGVLKVTVERPPATRNQPKKIEIRSGA